MSSHSLNLFSDANFYLLVIVLVILFRLKWRLSRSIASTFLILASLLVIFQFIGQSPLLLAAIIVYSASIILVAKGLLKGRNHFAPSMVLLILCLAVYKYRFSLFLPPLIPRWPLFANFVEFQWVGASYMTIKALDLLIGVRSGRVTDVRWIPTMLYFLFFATFVSGPIDRYKDFITGLNETTQRVDFVRFRRNLIRLCLGIIKITFLSQLALHNSVASPAFVADSNWPILHFILGLYCYLIYIFLDFSGYCDCAIAIADFLGIRIAENFQAPLIAPNIQEFWNRWHISLSTWCRDHIFFPLSRAILRRTSALTAELASVASGFVTFVIIGAWHGSSLNWPLYGAYHGLGFGIFTIYRSLMNRACPRVYENLQASRLYQLGAITLTFNFVACGLILTFSFSRIGALLRGGT